jgi:adenylate cyclase
VRIYGLLGDENAAHAPDFMALDELHGIMLRHYRAQEWTRAREALARCRGRDRRLEKLYDLYEHRIDAYAVDPPGPDWDGVYVARSK